MYWHIFSEDVAVQLGLVGVHVHSACTLACDEGMPQWRQPSPGACTAPHHHHYNDSSTITSVAVV
jgi:hypothetical protein